MTGPDPVQAEIAEWLAKAEGDLRVAAREAVITNNANPDAVAFHCQQAIEKLMKAALVARSITPPKVHDLPELLRRLNAAGVDWDWPLTELRTLTMAAVHARYPGYQISTSESAQLVAMANAIWDSLLPLVR